MGAALPATALHRMRSVKGWAEMGAALPDAALHGPAKALAKARRHGLGHGPPDAALATRTYRENGFGRRLSPSRRRVAVASGPKSTPETPALYTA